MFYALFALYCFGHLMISEGGISNKPLSLEERMLKKNVFTNASKHWHHYVRKLLHSLLEIHLPNYYKHNYFVLPNQHHPYDKNLLKCLQDMVQFVMKFVDGSQKVKRLLFYWVYSRILLKPSKTHMFIWTPSPITGTRGRGHALVYLNLHPHFHLNITFHFIYFSANTFNKCFFGSLLVSDIKGISKCRIASTIFRYCGIVPSFTLYLSSNKIALHINSKFFVTFSSIISLSIIDSCKIQSWLVGSKTSVAPTSVTKFVSPRSYLLQYQLQVERFQRLNILCNISNYELIEVYDGPGTLYNMLKPTNKVDKLLLYTTTTFQSFISLFTRKNPLSDNLVVIYKTIMSMNTQKVIYVKKNHYVQVTSERELNNTEIAIIKLKTVLHHISNITVLQMNYMGKNHSHVDLLE